MATNLSSSPPIPQAPVVKQDRTIEAAWYQFFVSLWARTGGATGNVSTILDQITAVIGSTLYRASAGWTGLAPGNQYNVLRMGVSVPEWDVLDGDSFAKQNANLLFAGPEAGAQAEPSFRLMASDDLLSVAGLIPGIPSGSLAPAGDVGEYVFEEIPSGSAVALTNATIANIASISLSPGDWDVWGDLAILPAGGADITTISGWVSSVSVTDPGPPHAGGYVRAQYPTALTTEVCLPVGSKQFSVNATQDIYLEADVAYSGGTVGGFGFIGARRRR